MDITCSSKKRKRLTKYESERTIQYFDRESQLNKCFRENRLNELIESMLKISRTIFGFSVSIPFLFFFIISFSSENRSNRFSESA